MSNGDDVLDDWEEIDEADLTNALQKIQAERNNHQQQEKQLISATAAIPTSSIASTDTKLFTLSNLDFPTPAAAASVPMKLLQRNANASNSAGCSSLISSPTATDSKSPLDDMASDFQPVMMMLHKPADEYQSTTYAEPTNLQTVKILRRPTQSSEPRNNGIRPRQPIKTLKQREQEYAEARLRILGSAKNPEDEVSNAPNSATNTAPTPAAAPGSTTTTTNTTNISKGYNATAKVNQNQIIGSGTLNQPNGYYQQQQLQQAHYFYMQRQQQQQQQPTQQRQQQLPPVYVNRTLSVGNLTTIQLPSVQHQTWSPVVGGSVSSPVLRQQQQESVLRLPRGPDGSTGFQMRR